MDPACYLLSTLECSHGHEQPISDRMPFTTGTTARSLELLTPLGADFNSA